MNPQAFLGLEATDDRMHWHLPIVPEICSGIGALFGGSALASAIVALETAIDRPVVWTSAQFLGFATPPHVLDLHIEEYVHGHQMSQASLTASIGDNAVFQVQAALGEREVPWSGAFATMPDVSPPDACPPRQPSDRWRNSIQSRMEARIADAREIEELDGTPSTGHAALWVRVAQCAPSPAMLAILGDYIPWGIGQALGLPVGGNSLDNTLRVIHRSALPIDTWILADVTIDAIADGFGHGHVHLWSETGTLLATASQSTVVREWDRPPASRRVAGTTPGRNEDT